MNSEEMKKVVILYDTHYRSTEEVALKIGENLKESRIDTNVYNLKKLLRTKNLI